MLHSSEAQCRDDDWSGLRDQAERRKRQNRLNVRAYRKRKALELHQIGQTETSTPDMSYGSSNKESRPNLSSGTSLDFIQWAPPGQPAAEAHRCSNPRSERDESQTRIQRPARNHNNGKSRLGRRVPPYFQNPTTWLPLYKDHLIPLVFYNVFRATIKSGHPHSATPLKLGPGTSLLTIVN
ncbi:hypothetical protein CCUS01_09220 [Colletotrichum cuscutae]|uniref:BZIP domain-containing protein n=1 Tax=Colletotrichum cuscutae TaxID=1209917 RepID=A0AAI9UM87_9PEZI|nr:hypothetical protein CCUS01_09220 [Colletotrichum cuscutae]